MKFNNRLGPIVFQMPSTPMFLCIVIEMILQMCDCFQLVIHHFHLLMTAYFHSFIHFIIFIPLVYFRVFWPTDRPTVRYHCTAHLTAITFTTAIARAIHNHRHAIHIVNFIKCTFKWCFYLNSFRRLTTCISRTTSC